MPDNKQKIYDKLTGMGMNSSFEEFDNYLTNNPQKVYDKLVTAGMEGTYDDFLSFAGVSGETEAPKRVDVSDVENTQMPTVTLSEEETATPAVGNYVPRGGEIAKMQTPAKLESDAQEYAKWLGSMPDDRYKDPNYNLYAAWKHLPKEELEAWRTATPEELERGEKHLRSVYYDDDNDEYVFLKGKGHESLQKELDWYNSDEPSAKKFREEGWKLDDSGDYYKYVKNEPQMIEKAAQYNIPTEYSPGNYEQVTQRIADLDAERSKIEKRLDLAYDVMLDTDIEPSWVEKDNERLAALNDERNALNEYTKAYGQPHDDYEQQIGKAFSSIDTDNVAEQAWNHAEQLTAEATEKDYENMLSGNKYTAFGQAMIASNPELAGAQSIKNMANRLTYHDLKVMSDDAWEKLGEEKQEAVAGEIANVLRTYYPEAEDSAIQDASRKIARQQSDQRMYQLAVEKNTPKNTTEYFFRKAVEANSVFKIMDALARSIAGTTGDMQAKEEAMQNFNSGWKTVLNVGGTVTGMVTDPLMYVSGAVGNVATKGVGAGASAIFGRSAVNKFGTTLGGKIAAGAIGGGFNLGTYEAGGEALNQLRWGGDIKGIDDNGYYIIGDYSGKKIARGFGHGFVMGGTIGVIAPTLGNISDNLVRATSNTGGKVALRAGELGMSTVAEGTVFSIPEFYNTYQQYEELIDSYSNENSPNYIADENKRAQAIDAAISKRKGAMMDVWTDNMAMMAGFKIKSVGQRLGELKSYPNSKAGFETRLRAVLDGSPDLALTKEEKDELVSRGYSDLKELTDAYDSRFQAKEKLPSTVTAEEEGALPVNRFMEMMNDNTISESARAKMYFYITGNVLPMSTIMGGKVIPGEDANGKATFTVQSLGMNGVVTSKTFTSEKAARAEMERISRQTELNLADAGERWYNYRNFELGKKNATEKLRKDIYNKYYVNVDDAIRKEPNRRSKMEADAVKEYLNTLWADQIEKQAQASWERKQAEADIERIKAAGDELADDLAVSDDPNTFSDAGRDMRDARRELADKIGEDRMQALENMDDADLAEAYRTASDEVKSLMKKWMLNRGISKVSEDLETRSMNYIGRFKEGIVNYFNNPGVGEQQRQNAANGSLTLVDVDGTPWIVLNTSGRMYTIKDVEGNTKMVDASRCKNERSVGIDEFVLAQSAPEMQRYEQLSQAFEGTDFLPEQTFGLMANGQSFEEAGQYKAVVVDVHNGNVNYLVYDKSKPGTKGDLKTATIDQFRDMTERFDAAQKKANAEIERRRQERVEDINDVPVANMLPGDAFPVAWDGQRAIATVVGTGANKTITVTDEKGKAIAENVSDIDDEQWEALRRMAVEMENAPVETAESVEVIENEPQPIGKGFFGNIYDQFKGKIKEAFDFLISHKEGDLLGVFHRDDIGDIDLIWGSSERKEGLEHIIEKHINRLHDFANIEEAMNVIDDVIKNGTAIKENPDKVNLDYNGYRVSIKKQIRDDSGNVTGKKNWVVTAFDKERSVKEKERSSSGGTLTTPPTNQSAGGVTLPPNEEHSGSKDTTISDTSDKKNEKNIPRDKNGNIDHAQLSKENAETYEAAVEEELGNVAKFAELGDADYLNRNLKEAQKKATEAANKKPKATGAAQLAKEIEKINATKQATQRAVDFWNDVKGRLEDAAMEQQTRLNEADKALIGLDENMKLYSEAPQEEILDKEPTNKHEFVSTYLGSFQKKENRLNKESLKTELGWSDSDLEKFRGIIAANGGMTLDTMAEMIFAEAQEQYPSFFADINDAKATIFDVLQEAGDVGNLDTYIKDRRRGGSEVQARLDYEARQLGYEDAADMRKKRMADAQQKLESLKDKNGFITEEGLKEFQDYVEGLKIKLEDNTPLEVEKQNPFYEESANEIQAESEEETPFTIGLAKQGDISGVTKEPKIVLDDFTSREDVKPIMNGVYYAPEGYAVATNGYVLVADKSQYDDKLSGKIVLSHNIKGNKSVDTKDQKKGEVIEGKFPNWKAIVNGNQNLPTSQVSFDGLRRFLAGAEDVFKSRWNQEKESGQTKNSFKTWLDKANVALRMPNGEVFYYRYNNLRIFTDAATRFGAKEISYAKGSVTLAKGADGAVAMMQVYPGETGYMDDDSNIVYYDWKSSDGGVANYRDVEVPFQKVGEENVPLSEDEIELRDAIIETIRSLGIEVNTDVEEGQRVLDEANGEATLSMSDSPETFKNRQERAVKEKGVVMPWLKDASVEIVRDIPKHHYTGTIKEATKQAIEAASEKYNPNGEAKSLYYDNYGQHFTYTITNNAIDEYLNPKQQKKSVNKGVHLALATHIDDVINNSIEVEEHPDYEKNDNGIRDGEKINPNALMHRFYGVAEVDGKLYRVMTLMREDMQSKPTNGIKAYEAQKIEVLNEESSSTTNGVGTPSEKNSTYPMAKLLKNIDKAYDKGKNILEESEKADRSPIQYFRTPDGKAYGFVKDGKIYVDPRIATSETPIHEYSHLWVEALKKANPEAWSHLKDMLTKDKNLMDYVRSLYPELGENTDALFEEVFAHFSGKRGAERLREEQKRMMDAADGKKEMSRVAKIFDTLKKALKKFWDMARKLFAGDNTNLKKMSAEDFADMAMSDLLNGVNPKDIKASVAKAMDKAYMQAVESGDMETAQRMVDEAAERAGYFSDSSYQGSLAFNGTAPNNNGYYETKEERKQAFDKREMEGDYSLGDFMDNGVDGNDLGWQLANPIAASGRDEATLQSIRNLNDVVKNGKRTIKMYRAVDSNIKENGFRNGDWITPSREYAKQHIELQDWDSGRIIEQEVSVDDIWWNGDDINEWGYDDSRNYVYKNTENNRKLLDAVTYDDQGNVIPLSQRFNSENNDIRYSKKNNLQKVTDDKQLSLFLQNNSGEYETKDGEKVKFASLLDRADSDVNTGTGTDGVQRQGDRTSPTEYRLRKLEEGETCSVERRYEESKQFNFTGGEKIESVDDVAYIFKQLENSAVENSFIILVKDGKPTVIHIGMGGYGATPANIAPAMVAYKNINPDKVYFVHNHPSGNIVCSSQDAATYGRYKQIFGDKLEPGIIIDTTSGYYGTFTEYGSEEQNMPTSVENTVPIKTYTFSQQVFAKGWQPQTAYKARNSKDVASFISSHRLGEHKKMSLLVINQEQDLVGNIFLPYTDLSEVPSNKELANEIAYYTNQMGGTAAIVYGNFDFNASDVQQRMYELSQILRSQDLRLLDAVTVDTSMDTASEMGLFEPDMEYGDKASQPEPSSEEELKNYNAGTLSTKEVVMKTLAEAAAKNKDDANKRLVAINAISKNLHDLALKLRQMSRGTDKLSKRAEQNIRGAVSGIEKATADYDKATIDQIVRLSKILMDSKLFKDFSNYEVRRLLAVTRDATGSKDITKQAEKVVDIMLDHAIKESEDVFEKMLSVKPTKIDTKGVKVQGKLNTDGQIMIEALKTGINLDKDKLNDKITDAQDRAGSDNTDIANNAAIELQGLQIASDYLNGVEDLRQSNILLKDDLKKAKAALDARKITRKEYDELAKETNDAIMQNKAEIVDAYMGIIKNLGSDLKDYAGKAKAFREADIADTRELQHKANSDLKHIDMREHHKKDLYISDRLTLWQAIISPLQTFEQMLGYIGRMDVGGKGYLYDDLMPLYHKASDEDRKRRKKEQAVLDNKAKEIFGKGVSSWGDLFSLIKGLNNITIDFYDGDKKRPHTVSQGSALAVYAWNKQTDGRMKLRAMGITEEDVDNITKQIDSRLIKLVDWFQEDYLPNKFNEWNKKYKEVFGASMTQVENYFPLRINLDSLSKAEDLTASVSDDNIASTITRNMMERKVNTAALDIMNSDAIDMMFTHVRDMEHWMAFVDFNKRLSKLLSYKRFRNKLKSIKSVRFGSEGDKRDFWDNFKIACVIASGAYVPRTTSFEKGIVKFQDNISTSKISLHVNTALKQFLSYPAYLKYSDPITLAKHFPLTNWKQTKDDWNWAIKNLPGFEKRWLERRAGDTRLRDVENAHSKTQHFFNEAARLGMTLNAFIDAITVCTGARAIVEHQYKQYLKDGYKPNKAYEKAILDAVTTANATQQSSENAYVSQLQLDKTYVAATVSRFRNASMGYTRQTASALDRLKALAFEKGYKDDSKEYSKQKMMRDGLSEEQAEKAVERAFRKQYWKAGFTAALFGFILPMLWNMGSHMWYYLFGKDKDEKERMLEEDALKAIAGPIEGLAGGNTISTMASNLEMGRGLKVSTYNLLSSPMLSDIQKMAGDFDNDWVAGAQDVLNILMASGTGIDLSVITDAAAGIMDAADGDLETSKEVALSILRFAQVPQSQMEQLYLDEIGLDAEEAAGLSVEEYTRRYVAYKKHRNTPATGWMYSEEKNQKVEDKYARRAERLIKERISLKDDKALHDVMNISRDVLLKRFVSKELAGRMGGKDPFGDALSTSSKEETKVSRLTYQTLRNDRDFIQDVQINKELVDTRKAYEKAVNDGDTGKAEALKERLDMIEDKFTTLRSIIRRLGKDNGKNDEETMNDIREYRDEFLEDLEIK